MRIASIVLSFSLSLPIVLAACGDSEKDADPFDTLQECFDEHHNMESLTVQQAIVVCCLDHPIAGVHPSCKDSQTDCVTHVRAELTATTLDADIAAACTTYLGQK
jgi:hypothetical protein